MHHHISRLLYGIIDDGSNVVLGDEVAPFVPIPPHPGLKYEVKLAWIKASASPA